MITNGLTASYVAGPTFVTRYHYCTAILQVSGAQCVGGWGSALGRSMRAFDSLWGQRHRPDVGYVLGYGDYGLGWSCRGGGRLKFRKLFEVPILRVSIRYTTTTYQGAQPRARARGLRARQCAHACRLITDRAAPFPHAAAAHTARTSQNHLSHMRWSCFASCLVVRPTSGHALEPERFGSAALLSTPRPPAPIERVKICESHIAHAKVPIHEIRGKYL